MLSEQYTRGEAPVKAAPPPPPPVIPTDEAPLAMPEFIALVAAMMSLTALGIDSMLPALPAIGEALGVADNNTRQFVITAFLIGFGSGHIIHGPLSDRLGRRRTLIAAMIGYAITNALCAVSGSFTLLLAARFAGGFAVAASRVSVVAIVRDCFSGTRMARVMSIAFIVFMIVPILAPAFGAAVLLVGDWRAIFWTIAGVSLSVLAWFAIRMPETLPEDRRKSIRPSRLIAGWKETVTDRYSAGYTLAATALLGSLYGYLNSIQQIVGETFGKPQLLTLIFALTAMTMAAANLANARLVMRVGTRMLSHGAILVLIATSTIHLIVILSGGETLVSFVILQAITMGCFGLATSNFSAMAMENMGGIAGTASSVQGFVSIIVGATIGAIIGQSFNGTPAPLALGFVSAGVVALAIVLVTERGRLFRLA